MFPEPHVVISGAFPEVAGSRVYDAGIHSWYNAEITRVRDVSATHPEYPG